MDPWRLRVSCILVILGLLVEAFPLVWNHPVAFWLFVFVGAGFLLSGIVIFLYTFVAHFVTSRS
jgi:hypothetical protein